MFQAKIIVLFSLSLFTSAFAKIYSHQSNGWSDVIAPRGTISQAIGGYANGCQTGAVAVPESGEGFYSIRRWRKRFYTQPVTLDLIQTVGKALAPRKILIGDASMPIGGKMPSGHASHQNGLDVDLWFYTIGENELPPSAFSPASPNINHEDPPSMADKLNGTMNIHLWKPEYRQALYTAAKYPATTRIFVNPIIKQYLCETETDKSWLYKIRPYWGHDSHFHIRLACPFDDLFCEAQEPAPQTDGCDADLKKWIFDQSEAIRNPKPAKKSSKSAKPIHAECRKLLNLKEK